MKMIEKIDGIVLFTALLGVTGILLPTGEFNMPAFIITGACGAYALIRKLTGTRTEEWEEI